MRSAATFQVAAWLLGPHATPSDRYYAFGHAADEQANWELQWKATKLGLTDFGSIVNVDKEPPPYRGSHLLLTEAKPAPGGENNIASIVTDGGTPKNADGQPVHAPVWQYVCFG